MSQNKINIKLENELEFNKDNDEIKNIDENQKNKIDNLILQNTTNLEDYNKEKYKENKNNELVNESQNPIENKKG